MARRTKATLRGAWWRRQIRLIRRCFSCGGKLRLCYVAEEKCRRRRCTACGQITYINPKVVAGLIPVAPGGRVVLLRRGIEPALGRWSYPAGFMEMGESVGDAAERETFEEIRARVTVGRLIGIYSYADAGVVTIVYEGKLRRGERPRPGTETEAVDLFRPEEIPWNELAFRSTVDALRDWADPQGRRFASGVRR